MAPLVCVLLPACLTSLEKGWQEQLRWGRRENERMSRCSHPDWGDKGTLLFVQRPEEVCLPQPTVAHFYTIELQQSLPKALAPVWCSLQQGQKRGWLRCLSRIPSVDSRQSREHLLGFL